MNTLKALYNKFPKPDNWKLWILISLVIKSLFIIYFMSMVHSYGHDFWGFNYKGSFAKAGGDTPSYFQPIENLISNGKYADDHRMPGYGWLYYFCRLIFNPTLSFNIIIFVQLLFSAISVYILGLISLIIFDKKICFYFTYFLYLLSTFVSIYDYVLMTESLTVSTLIIAIYLFLLFVVKKKPQFLFYSGLFITWSIFLRPIIFPVLIIFTFFLLIDFIKTKATGKKIIKYFLILLIPFLIIDGLWVYRNYKLYGKFYPFQKSSAYASVMSGYGIHAFNFVSSFGGHLPFWESNSELIYFIPESNLFYENQGKDTSLSLIPPYVYTSAFNKDSLLNIRKMIIKLYNSETIKKDNKEIENLIIRKFDAYKSSIKYEKPMLFYVFSRLIILNKFFVYTDYGFGYIWYYWDLKNNYKLFNIYKIFSSLVYYFIVVFGFIGCFVLTLRKSFLKVNNYVFLISTITIYLTFVYPFIFLLSENRYFVTTYPLFVITINSLLLLIMKLLLMNKRVIKNVVRN